MQIDKFPASAEDYTSFKKENLKRKELNKSVNQALEQNSKVPAIITPQVYPTIITKSTLKRGGALTSRNKGKGSS